MQISRIDTTKQRMTHGERTRQDILRIAVDIASAEGLEGLTIGRLAKELGMSKSGLFGHFGSKQDLQLATVETARDIFIQEVIQPVEETMRGLERLRAMVESWLSYVERNVFRGGCFFMAASTEFDGRPGPVRDLVAELTKAWVDMMVMEVREAQQWSQIKSNVDPEQLIFELHALVQEANWAFQLHQDTRAFERAQTGIQSRLELVSKP